MRALRALRALARVELRGLARHPGRSWLVALLVAVPVAAIAGGSTLLAITQPTVAERQAAEMGRAALRVDVADAAERERARALLPDGARVVTVHGERVGVRVPGRRLAARGLALEPGALERDGLAHGLLCVTRGRAPAGPTEVALSPVLLRALGRAVGETVTAADGERAIVGAVVDPEDLGRALVLRAPAADDGATRLLVGLAAADAPAVAARLRTAGLRAVARSEVGASDGFEALVVFVVGGIGLLEAALVVAAAFAVGLRRRQRELGLLGATGATGGGLLGALLLSAGALALVGAALGTAAGVGAAAALHPFLDGWNGRLNGPFELPLARLAGGAALGLGTALAAAALPARTAARRPVRAALGGRRPLTGGAGRWLAGGVAMVLGGLALLAVGAGADGAAGTALLAGSALGVGGLGACSPWILERLARHAARLPLAWRLAVRDAGRFRARNGPVVTAILAGMSISVTVAALGASLEGLPAFRRAAWRDDWLVVDGPGAEPVARRLAAELGALASAPLAAVTAHGDPVRARLDAPGASAAGWIACGDAELLRALDLEAALPALRAGRLLVLDPDAPDAPVVLATGAGGPAVGPADLRRFERADVERVAPTQRVRGPHFVLGRDRARVLGLEPGPPPGAELVPWTLRLPRAVTPLALERARAAAAEIAGTAVDAARLHAPPARPFVRAVLLVCFLTGLVVLAVATALSAAESAADRRVLHAVGASPRALRGQLAARAGYLALLGCALAVPAGMLPAVGLLSLASVPLELTVPWTAVLVTVLALPVTAYGGAWLVAARRGPSWKTSTAS